MLHKIETVFTFIFVLDRIFRQKKAALHYHFFVLNKTKNDSFRRLRVIFKQQK
jgi:hypothetical protein